MTDVPQTRRLAADDFDSVRGLLELCRLPTADLAVTMLPRFIGLFAAERLAGVGGLELLDGTVLLRSMAVAPGLRRRGYAARILALLEHDAQALGADALYLLTDAAVPFFAAHGYEPLPRQSAPPGVAGSRQFTELCGDRAVVMRKRLG